MNHSAQVNLIAPHTVDGKDSGGAFRGSHYSTHRHTHARCKCAPAHTPFTLPGCLLVSGSNLMSGENCYMVNCVFFCFFPHLGSQVSPGSLFQTTDLPEVSLPKPLTYTLEPCSPTSDPFHSSQNRRELQGHCRAVISVNVGAVDADADTVPSWALFTRRSVVCVTAPGLP